MSEEIGQEAVARLSAKAIEQMRAAIQEAGGREVFFAGPLDGHGRVARVRVWARGHEGAVPAVFEGLCTHEVVLHNHPSGEIAPSDADLQLASLFSFQGHGVYIVDNEVNWVYAVVEPLLDRDKKTLDPAELAALLGPDSAVARVLPQFEVRPQQADMMGAVARAFNAEGIAVIEAPTGVGKTLAYLAPAIVWAVRNGERVVVSTRTINLQEQIMFKDIPLLQGCLGIKFHAVLVKGRNNYLCWRRFTRALSEASLFEDNADQAALKRLDEWAQKTQEGSRSDLPFIPPRELWSQICSESDTCRPMNCSYAKKCFIGKARREIAKADILVVNHHMLFSDLAVKRELGNFNALAVLPAYRRLIFDEAHSIEDSATEYFGMEATRMGALALIGRFIRMERAHERGLLPFLKLKLMKETLNSPYKEIDDIFLLIENELMPHLASAREGLQAAFDAIRSITAERCGQIGREIKWRLTPEALKDPALRDVHQVYVLPVVQELRECAKWCAQLHERVRKLESPPDYAGEPPFLTELMQLSAYQNRLERLASNLAEGISESLEPNTVRWIEIDAHDRRTVRVVRCPLEVGGDLAGWVYGNLKTIVMTSATLAVRQRFDFLFHRIGLDSMAGRSTETLALPTPFDYQEQALLCIPTELSDPGSSTFLDDSEEYIREALAITRGHAFVLFTSFHALEHAYQQLEGEIRRWGVTLLKQGEAARTQLLERFRRDTSSVLFATDSFWEGVDVAGEALQCVILPRLPFRVPTEPILEARAEAIDAAGGNSFMEYVVPQAVIKFRQGFGRLIRRRSDRGSILVLDRRVVTKHYGRIFLESLPGLRIIKGPRDGVMEALRQFHGGANEEA